MRRKGIFITFEGGDGAGKTTLIEKLYASLENSNHEVLKTRAPGGTTLGAKIRHLLLEQTDVSISKRAELLLFLSDRAQHVDEVILPALQANTIVLCDRFNDSTIAYQGGARGFDYETVRNLCNFSCEDLQPDLTLYLDLDPVIGFERVQSIRGSKDRIESETLEFHQRIRHAFHQIAEKEPNRFHLIDASQSIEAVFLDVKKQIDKVLKSR